MAANALMHDIHNTGNNPHRMPAIERRKDWEPWLCGAPDDAVKLLTQYPPDLMTSYEVSTRVNNQKSQGPELISKHAP